MTGVPTSMSNPFSQVISLPRKIEPICLKLSFFHLSQRLNHLFGKGWRYHLIRIDVKDPIITRHPLGVVLLLSISLPTMMNDPCPQTLSDFYRAIRTTGVHY